jgi:hypothetical protein
MRSIHTSLLASLASLTVIGSAEAQVFTGFTTAPGVITAVPATNQSVALADLQTSFLKLFDTAGATIPGTFLIVGGSVKATYTSAGATTTVTMTPLAANQTKVMISQVTPAGGKGIKRVEFGTVNSRVGFDLVNGAALSVGSGVGFNPLATLFIGNPWTANLHLVNRVSVAGAAPLNDLHKTMAVNFVNPIFNGTFEFIIDTDRLY